MSFLGSSEGDEDDRPHAPRGVSNRMLASAVRVAERKAGRLPLDRLIPAGQFWRSLWLCAAVLVVALPLSLWNTTRAATALVRLADPFGHALLQVDEADPFLGLGKIAALGIKVSRHCSYHGLALNVAMDLQPYGRINPCGYAGLRTVDLRSLGVAADWNDVARRLAAHLARRLQP